MIWSRKVAIVVAPTGEEVEVMVSEALQIVEAVRGMFLKIDQEIRVRFEIKPVCNAQ
jgi:hypothetical protein